MRLHNDGFSLWCGTPDAPAPSGEVPFGAPASLTVGATPMRAGNAATVVYRVDGGLNRVLPMWPVSTDHNRGVQYFRAKFPPFFAGKLVEYMPVLSNGGGRVPAYAQRPEFPGSFTLVDRPKPVAAANDLAASVAAPARPTFTPKLGFVAEVTYQVSGAPDLIGETPLGLRINYFLEGGHVRGPRLNGRVLPRGADTLTIRRDGVGAVRVRASIETHDGAVLAADYYGTLDLGPQGYERATRGQFPDFASVQLAPRLISGDARYEWVNRHQFMGVGQVSLSDARVQYDLFSLESDVCRRA